MILSVFVNLRNSPEGGNKVGYIIAEGTPEKVAGVKESHTGKFLKAELVV